MGIDDLNLILNWVEILGRKNIVVYYWNDYYWFNCKKGIWNR